MLKAKTFRVFSLSAKETPVAAVLCHPMTPSGGSTSGHLYCKQSLTQKSSGNILKTYHCVPHFDVMPAFQGEGLEDSFQIASNRTERKS